MDFGCVATYVLWCLLQCVYAHEHAELRPKPVEIQQLEAKQKSQLGQKFSPTTVSTDVKTVSNPWIKKKSKIPANAKQSEVG